MSLGTNAGRFHTTRWSLVRRAGGDEPESRAALEELCALYWPAVYAYLRRSGSDRERALDQCQGVFARILERGDLATVDPERGSFRAWLRTCARNHAANQRAEQRAEKRGGRETVLSIDASRLDEAEAWLEPIDTETPDQVFDRFWARALLDRVVAKVRSEQIERGRGDLFDALLPRLTGGTDDDAAAGRSYESIADEFDASVGSIKVLVHRLRQRLRELIVFEVRQTLQEDDDGVGELDRLASVLGSSPNSSR